MVEQYRPSFPHRLNHDGSCDSICTLCYQTVATASEESELALLEQSHRCDPVILNLIGQSRLPYYRALSRLG